MDREYLLQIGIKHYQKKQYQKALEDFNQIIFIYPNFAKAYHYRGWVYKALENKEEAMKNFKQAASIFKDSEYTKLCNQIQYWLKNLRFHTTYISYPDPKEANIYGVAVYLDDFWVDEDGHWHEYDDDDIVEIDLGNYITIPEQKLEDLERLLFQRLEILENLPIKHREPSKFDAEKLKTYGLPICNSPEEIADLMGISTKELEFLAYSRKHSHYNQFEIPKKTGGTRNISAPIPLLKKAHKWILKNILEKLEPHNAAHGFRLNRSIVTNAQPHVKQEVILNFDLKDFFPSISYQRVKGVFHSCGYSETASIIFGLLCTEPMLKNIGLQGEVNSLISWTQRYLPQGAPTSPAISNLLCRRLDQRLTEMANKYGFVYTRYADDLTFSASGNNLFNIAQIMNSTRGIVKSEGFNINEDKTRILRKSRHQEVTGVVVNNKLNISRQTLKRFRATLYQIEQNGFEGKHWGESKNKELLSSLEGFTNFVLMVNPEKGAKFREQLKRIKAKYLSH